MPCLVMSGNVENWGLGHRISPMNKGPSLGQWNLLRWLQEQVSENACHVARAPATDAPVSRGLPSPPSWGGGAQTTLPKSSRKPSKQGLALCLREGRGSLAQESAGAPRA